MSQVSAPNLQVIATDRVALVTGAARGIGRAIALRLAADGFHVALNDLSKMSNELEKVKSEIESGFSNIRSCIIFADVSKQNEVCEMVNKTVQELGRLDVMVANAGIQCTSPFLEATEEDFDRILNVNAKSVFFCYQEAAKQMIKQGHGGKLIGASSLSAHRPFKLGSLYAISKWAVRGMTQAAALELAKHKINVNCYCPGAIDTDMFHDGSQAIAEQTGVKQDDIQRRIVHQWTAMERMGQPDDVAQCISFLASQNSNFVTGQSLLIDGGIHYT
ncbi:unnamed protein product [Didymodactylos carnosus]|uniref:Uncharacterized protein n=1 Tax=Didymodactylos carnosus TaxID=1234261 RepID=A0A815H415_9BILA|nr:unnamed protein product [Didymodactylos carnosus]CAF1346503.1 unnamed protein product [Didymodactylos carnosus]CAF1449628.1 unnamed protein product [Didymodactylos carnosus]CAF4212825.1 unnamed protein product [Didymodactylos carnosus]CAF4212835.1 unnamed protein product [Didymodactylos carnosus]